MDGRERRRTGRPNAAEPMDGRERRARQYTGLFHSLRKSFSQTNQLIFSKAETFGLVVHQYSLVGPLAFPGDLLFGSSFLSGRAF